MTGTTGYDEIPAGLVRRARAGGDEALEELVARVYPLVRRWTLVHTGDPTEADDLTQDVLVHLIRRLSSYRSEARFTTWLYALTRNAALDRHRTASRRRGLHRRADVDAHVRPSSAPDPERRTQSRADQGLLRTFLVELPRRQREAVELVDLRGLDSKEASRRMGIRPVSVRAHLHRARKTLRERILERHPHLVEDRS